MNRRLHRLAHWNRWLVVVTMILLAGFSVTSWLRVRANRRIPPPPVTSQALRGGQIIDVTTSQVVIQPFDQPEVERILVNNATVIRVLDGELFRTGDQSDLVAGAFMTVAGEALVEGEPVREIHVMDQILEIRDQRSEDGAE